MKLEAYCSGFLLLLLIACISNSDATAVRGRRRATSDGARSGKKVKKMMVNGMGRSNGNKLTMAEEMAEEGVPVEWSDDEALAIGSKDDKLSNSDVEEPTLEGGEPTSEEGGEPTSEVVEPTSRTCQVVHDDSYEYKYDQTTFEGIPWHNEPLPQGYPLDAMPPAAYSETVLILGALPVVLNTFYTGKCARRQNLALLAGESIDGPDVCDVAVPSPALEGLVENLELLLPRLTEMLMGNSTEATPAPTTPLAEMTPAELQAFKKAEMEATAEKMVKIFQILGKILQLPQAEIDLTIRTMMTCYVTSGGPNLNQVALFNMLTECSLQDSPDFGWAAPNDVQSFNLAVNDSFYQMYEPPTEVVSAFFSGPEDEVGMQWMSDDDLFGYMRLTGPNPDMIRKAILADVGPDTFPVTDEMWQTAMDVPSTLNEAIEDGEVYILDFSALQSVEGTNGLKILFSPKTLFGVNEAGSLVPIAIQVYSDPSHEDNDIIAPPQQRNWEEASQSEKVDLLKWSLAKTAVNSAESSYFELITHLALTHMVMEPFIISSKRHLPSEHPISMLLQNHIFGTIAINTLAANMLMAPNNTIDWSFPPAIEVSQKLSTDAVKVFLSDVNEQAFPKRMAKNGVEDLPNYPYKDDGILEWEAMRDFVEEFLYVLYDDDTAVANDPPLSCWANDMKENGMMDNFGTDGSNEFTSVEGLTDFLTLFMFTGSCQHAATNYAQGVYPLFSPIMPLSGYTNPNDVTEENVESMAKVGGVPKQRWNTFAGNDIVYFLQSLRWYKLGDYVKDEDRSNEELFSGDYLKVVKDYRKELVKIGKEIDERNSDPRTLRGSLLKYELLHPANVPQSIHI